MGAIDVRPVTAESWEAFARLFEAKGGPHFCWCTTYRVAARRDLTTSEKKACMRELVRAGTPVGVMAFKGDEPVGWCSVAPRETYVRLERSRTMPRVTPVSSPTWTVLCLFVPRPHRGERIGHALLAGAVAYARDKGAAVLEGYPFDTAGVSSTHRGHSRIFRAGGFQRDGKRWFVRLRA